MAGETRPVRARDLRAGACIEYCGKLRDVAAIADSGLYPKRLKVQLGDKRAPSFRADLLWPPARWVMMLYNGPEAA